MLDAIEMAGLEQKEINDGDVQDLLTRAAAAKVSVYPPWAW